MSSVSTTARTQSTVLPVKAPFTLSVIIVVWNAREYVLECLNSMREHCAGIYTEVFVVDNASTDGTADLVEKQFPEFTLIRNSENLGFAKANNIAMELCTGDYVCLVNSDVKFINDPITPMIEYLAANPSVGMIGPKMLGPALNIRRSTMRFPTVWNYFCHAVGLDKLFNGSRFFGGFLMVDFDHQRTTAVDVLNGWFVIVRREGLQNVGLLDPQFFMYGEDVDWCRRFSNAGNQIVFFAEAEAIHYGGASSANEPVRFSVEQNRADWQCWCKHHGWGGRVGWLIVFSLHHLLRLAGAAFGFLFHGKEREDYVFKVKRSIAALRWMTSLGAPRA